MTSTNLHRLAIIALFLASVMAMICIWCLADQVQDLRHEVSLLSKNNSSLIRHISELELEVFDQDPITGDYIRHNH